MAQVQVNFISKSLMRTVTFNAIVPVDKVSFDENKKIEQKPLKSLYLLHGGFGNHTDYISGTRIQRWAEENNLAVFMPDGENQFYNDKPERGENYGAYVAQELVDFTRKMFPLSDKREDTFIAGLSMGGYGALINGLKYHDTFGYIGAFSPALMNEDIIVGDPSTQIAGFTPEFYTNVFGNLSQIKGSDKDYYYLIEKLQAEGIELPQIYLPIGFDDFLLESVQKYKKFLDEKGIEITYIEAEGAHEWDFWDKYLKAFLDWLPLDDKESTLNSGNVKA